MLLTYKEAYDRIIDAYYKDEIVPFNTEFCFCGTLAPDSHWRYGRASYPYTPKEYGRMEHKLFQGMVEVWEKKQGFKIGFTEQLQFLQKKAYLDIWEEALFEGMSKALDVLKQIHLERGEEVDEITFHQREKQHDKRNAYTEA